MKLLNSQTILRCQTNEEIENHNKEIEDIISQLRNGKNYECAAIIKRFDEAGINKEPIIKSCYLHECQDMVQYVDIKQGVDIALVGDFLTFICYGSEYKLNESIYVVTAGIQIRPYNENRDFILLDSMKGKLTTI